MFENISYKHKFFALIIIAVILGFTAYKRSFKLTFNSINEYAELSYKLDYINDSSTNIHSLDNEIDFLNNLIGSEDMEPELIQQEILNFVTHNTKEINVVNIEEVHKAVDNGFAIYSNQLTIEGGFEDLLKVIYEFEKKFSISRLVNVSFFKEKDYKTKTTKLFAKIIFQNYEKIIK